MSEETTMVLVLFFIGLFALIVGVAIVVKTIKDVLNGTVNTSYEKKTYLSKDSTKTVHRTYNVHKNPVKFSFSLIKELATGVAGFLIGIASLAGSIITFLEQ